MRPHTLSLLSVLAFPLIGSAQTTVVTLFQPGADYSPFRASVVGVDATATTYKLACPDTGNGCGYVARPPDITVVAGPSTAVETVIVDSLTQFSTLACPVSASTQIVGRCSRVGKDNGSSFTYLDSLPGGTYAPVTVTAGVEKLARDAGQTTQAGGPQNSAQTSTATVLPSSSGAAGNLPPPVLSTFFIFLYGFLA